MRQSEYLADKYTKLPKSAAPEEVNDSRNETEQSQDEAVGSDVMRCALGLIMHKLGLNFYETEEQSEGLTYLKKSFELMDSLPDVLKLRHLNVIQDLYNHIAIILSDRAGVNDEAEKKIQNEALQYLDKAKEIYNIVVSHTKELPQKNIMNNFDKFMLK